MEIYTTGVTKGIKFYDGTIIQTNETNTNGSVTIKYSLKDTNYTILTGPKDTYYVPRITARSSGTQFSTNGRNIDNSGLTGASNMYYMVIGTVNDTPKRFMNIIKY